MFIILVFKRNLFLKSYGSYPSILLLSWLMYTEELSPEKISKWPILSISLGQLHI